MREERVEVAKSDWSRVKTMRETEQKANEINALPSIKEAGYDEREKTLNRLEEKAEAKSEREGVERERESARAGV